MAQKFGSRVNNRKSHGKTIVSIGVITLFIAAFLDETRRYRSFFGRNSVKETYFAVKKKNYGYVSSISLRTQTYFRLSLNQVLARKQP